MSKEQMLEYAEAVLSDLEKKRMLGEMSKRAVLTYEMSNKSKDFADSTKLNKSNELLDAQIRHTRDIIKEIQDDKFTV